MKIISLAFLIFLSLSSCKDDLPAPLPNAPDFVVQRCLMIFSERDGEEKRLIWSGGFFESEDDEVITADKGRTMWCHQFLLNKGKRLNESKPAPINDRVYFSVSLQTMAAIVAYIVEWVPFAFHNR